MPRKNRNADQPKRSRPLLINKPPPKIEVVDAPEFKPEVKTVPVKHGGYTHSWERGTG